MTDKAVGGAEQIAAHAGVADEGSHQQEHRYDAEGVISQEDARLRCARAISDDMRTRLALALQPHDGS